MRDYGGWGVCGAVLVAQLGCWGDAVSADRGGAAVPGDEPGEGPTLDEPVASGEPLEPGEGEPPTSGEEEPPTRGEPPTSGEEEPSTPSQPPTSGQPPPFGSETGICSIFAEFSADAPLNDTRGTGFSALDMLSIFNEQGPGTLTWLDGTTTTLSIAARVVGNTSVVDDPPRGEGYCVPFRQVPVQLRMESADGRLAEDVASALVAVGYDGNIESIWLSDGHLPLEELQGGLEVPSEWLIAGHTERRLAFDTAWVAPDALNPFCNISDVPSADASEGCNVYTGVVRFFSSAPFPTSAEDPDADEISQSLDFRGVVGSWVLAR
jgi:hypothetical protein